MQQSRADCLKSAARAFKRVLRTFPLGYMQILDLLAKASGSKNYNEYALAGTETGSLATESLARLMADRLRVTVPRSTLLTAQALSLVHSKILETLNTDSLSMVLVADRLGRNGEDSGSFHDLRFRQLTSISMRLQRVCDVAKIRSSDNGGVIDFNGIRCLLFTRISVNWDLETAQIAHCLSQLVEALDSNEMYLPVLIRGSALPVPAEEFLYASPNILSFNPQDLVYTTKRTLSYPGIAAILGYNPQACYA